MYPSQLKHVLLPSLKFGMNLVTEQSHILPMKVQRCIHDNFLALLRQHINRNGKGIGNICIQNSGSY
jgi:hypothetical protein